MKNFLATLKWRTIIGLILVYASMWFNWPWIWGIIALFWVIPDLITGTTFFMEPISKYENPFLYWIIVITWLSMSVYFLALFFYPDLQLY